MNAWKYTTKAELTNSIMGAVSEVTSEIDKLRTAKIQADLNNWSAQYQVDANNFLNNLQHNNKYQTWEQDTNDFLEEQKEKYKNLATNSYSAQLVDQMLNSYRPGLINTVQQRAWQAEVNDVVSTTQQTMQLNYNNLSGQALFNANKACLDTLYKGGYIDTKNYQAQIINLGTNAAIKAGHENIDRLIEQEIQNDQTGLVSSFLDDMDNSIEMSYISSYVASLNSDTKEGEIPISLDNAAIKTKLQDYYKTNYQIQLQNYQSQNEKKVDQLYSQCSNDLTNLILGTGDVDEKTFYTRLKYGSDLVTNTMGGNKMSKGTQSQYVDHFRSLLNAYTSWSKAGGSTGTGSGSKSIKLESLNSIYKDRIENLGPDIMDGKMSIQDAQDMMTADFKNAFFNGYYEENSDINKNMYSPDDKEKLWNSRYSNSVAVMFMNSINTQKYMEKNLPTVNALMKDITKKMETDPAFNPSSIGMRNFTEAVNKIIYNMDKNVKEEDVMDQIMKYAAACNLDGYVQGRNLFETQGKHESEEDYLQRTIEDAENNDVVFSPRNEPYVLNENKERVPNIISFTDESNLKEMETKQKDLLASILDVSPESIKSEHKTAPAVKGAKLNNDYSTEYIFTADNGKKYEYDVTKNDDGKTTGFTIQQLIPKTDDKGKVMTDDEGNLIYDKKEVMNSKDYYSKASQRERDKASNENQNNFGNTAKSKGEEKDQFDDNRHEGLINNLTSITKKPSLISDKYGWDNEKPASKEFALSNTIKDITKKAKQAGSKNYSKSDFEKEIGVSADKWKKWTAEQRQEYVLTHKN